MSRRIKVDTAVETRANRKFAYFESPFRFTILLALVVAIFSPVPSEARLRSSTSPWGDADGAKAQRDPQAKPKENSQLPQDTVQGAPVQSNSERAVAKPPVVAFEEGQLTILAENSRLSDVLSEVRKLTGADVDIPATAGSEMVWVHLGPGPALSVLRDLLDGTEFNYVVQASETDAEGIRSIQLSLRSKGAQSGNYQAGLRDSTEQSSARRIPRANGSAQEIPDVDQTATTDSANPPVSASADPATPANDGQPSTNAQASVTPRSNLSQPAGRSSQQMMQQLQSMYQQRKQIQQQLNQNPPQNPPPPQN